MQKHIQKHIQDLQLKKQEVRTSQKKYFKISQKYLKEKQYFYNKYEKALSKEKLEEVKMRKDNLLKDYENVFMSFKQLFQDKNFEIEKVCKSFIEFDSVTKKEICLSWDFMTTKLIEDIEIQKVENNKWNKGQVDVDIQGIFSPFFSPNIQITPSLQHSIELSYFDIKSLFLPRYNNFSLFFLDFEFKNLKKCSIDNIEKNSKLIYNSFHIKKNSIHSKDFKLIEELILAFHKNNEFFYSDENYRPAKMLKSILIIRYVAFFFFFVFETSKYEEEVEEVEQ